MNFLSARQRARIRVVALAHHADDQVELFFLRVLRGAGGEGLAGMEWRSPSPANKKIVLVRPLLDVTKDELHDFAHGTKSISVKTGQTRGSIHRAIAFAMNCCRCCGESINRH